jgi:hypothetical protein
LQQFVPRSVTTLCCLLTSCRPTLAAIEYWEEGILLDRTDLVDAADSKTKGAAFDPFPVHIITDKQDKLGKVVSQYVITIIECNIHS